MRFKLVLAFFIFLLFCSLSLSKITLDPTNQIEDYFYELHLLIAEILHTTKVDRCFTIITDNIHEMLFDATFFGKAKSLRGNFIIRILDSEDMLSPNYQTVKVLKAVKANNCDLIFILILNGIQMKRFLMFINENRILNSRSKFVLFYDHRILTEDMVYIWRKIVRSVFIRKVERGYSGLSTRFTLLTVPYPNILRGTLAIRELVEWRFGKFSKEFDIFSDKTNDLKGYSLQTVVYDHVPMAIKIAENSYAGLEVEIIKSLGEIMNFVPEFYETSDKTTERWGRLTENGTYTGLIGEMVNSGANLAIGDLHFNLLYMKIMDLSIPHSRECLTFLTPESSQDNSWKTLILPFSFGMWTGVLLSLVCVGTLFYIFSWLHNMTSRRANSSSNFFRIFRKNKPLDYNEFKKSAFKRSLSQKRKRQESQDLFDSFANCILLTYSMLMFVSLPRMPRNWPLRMLTGWYWVYCILVVVTYRASFTAILANPAPRITIDTIEELAASKIHVGAWGTQNKKFFEFSLDEAAQKIGSKLDEVDDIYGITERISKGVYAYYDNEYFLRYLRSLGISDAGVSDEVLHIMKQCVVNMPVSLGLEKNSPLKPNIDKYLRRLIEGGLVSKWLKDATSNLPAEESAPQEALMDLKKFWSCFVALIVGYVLATFALFLELLHFRYIVTRHPLYDFYNPRMYYNYLRMIRN